MRLFISCILLLQCLVIHGQCDISISGRVLDRATKSPLEYALIMSEGSNDAYIADSLGFFKIDNVCPGDLHLSLSHLACSPEHIFIELKNDTIIDLFLEHHFELLDEVVVHGHSDESGTNASSTISKREIESESYKSLAELSARIVGVSMLRNGTTSAKPIVHGLYGNRLTILNNGISQSGQQWGNDHAPEIDASNAHHISVVKGASALSYMGNNLGSVVLVESNPVSNDPNIQGTINYIYNQNGRGNTLSGTVEKKSKLASWRIGGSLKHSGDQKSPDYYLKNTGRREQNAFILLERNKGNLWHHQLLLSSFNANLGILRGSQVSNLTDLESAFQRQIPFFTEDNFSDSIAPPKQTVNHHLVKIESKYFLNDNTVFKFKYGGQLNLRREFDIRRNNRSAKPSLSLKQYSHFLESKIIADLNNLWTINTGLQFQFMDNVNDVSTGILPLIPNYRSFNPAMFVIFQIQIQGWSYELGTRLDYKHFIVKNINNSIPPTIETKTNDFINYSLSGGLIKRISKSFKSALNIAHTMRSPEINELYSFGLHQGVSGIEEGDRDLKQERSFKIISSSDWNFKDKIFVQFLAYYQEIGNYIYLQAEDEFRLTIRGAFPLFKFKQTNARIWGSDLLLSLQMNRHMKLVGKYAYIRAQDKIQKNYLVNIPSDNTQVEIQYAFNNGKKLSNSYIHFSGQYSFKQSRISISQDYIEAPDAYFLIGFKAGTSFKLSKRTLELGLFANNILNNSYRDYLNRLRYFADETGIDVGIRVKYKWES